MVVQFAKKWYLLSTLLAVLLVAQVAVVACSNPEPESKYPSMADFEEHQLPEWIQKLTPAEREQQMACDHAAYKYHEWVAMIEFENDTRRFNLDYGHRRAYDYTLEFQLYNDMFHEACLSGQFHVPGATPFHPVLYENIGDE